MLDIKACLQVLESYYCICEKKKSCMKPSVGAAIDLLNFFTMSLQLVLFGAEGDKLEDEKSTRH